MGEMRKYPRTRHIEGSRLQPNDEDLESAPFDQIKGRFLVVEEKMDGANSGISFSTDGQLLLQSRGHYLTGGPREKHFTLFKRWGHTQAARLREVLEDRYLMYGEWLYAKHTVFYNELPHYFMEFDVLDKQTGLFLDTARRQTLLKNLPVVSVSVLHEGPLHSLEALKRMVGPSRFIRHDALEELGRICRERGLDPDRIFRETDPSGEMEGLYIKVEEEGIVKERYKFIRRSFLTAVLHSESHWLDRPIIPNRLAGRVGSLES
jgi:hypothetical protein